MAAHPHHHHHHLQTTAIPAATCFCSHCCVPPSHTPSPHQTTETNTLVQALTSLLLQQQQQQQSPPDKSHNFHNHHKAQSSKHQKSNLHQQRREEDPHFILSSLIQRIDALESSLHRFSVSTTSRSSSSSSSLRETAARVIQIHFRAFLVRRSRTLGQLKELAFIKSVFNSLKISVSKRSHFDFDAVSSKATELLIELDSIQGGDPMIRDGKRSITRDLVKFLDFIDGVAVKRQEVSYRAVKNVRCFSKGDKGRVLRSKSGDLDGNRREVIQNLRDRVQKISRVSKALDNDEENAELEGCHQVICDEEVQNPFDLPLPVNVEGYGVSTSRRNRNLGKMQGGQSRVKKSESVELEGFHQVICDVEEQNPFDLPLPVNVDGYGGRINKTNSNLGNKQGGQSKVKKSVSFAKNGNLYKMFAGTRSDSSDEQVEEEKLSNEIEDDEDDSYVSEAEEEELHSENGGSSHSSDAGKSRF